VTPVPPPESPALRVRLGYTNEDGFDAGSRFFLGYSGSAPSSGNLVTLAGDIATAWATDLAPLINTGWTLTEVDIIDIATDTGASGTATVSHEGTAGGGNVPAQAATNVEFDIARRYRGGKPRMFLPPPGETALDTAATWSSSFVTEAESAIPAFFTAVEALSVGSLGALTHVNLSYYSGFTNVTNSSGRTRAAPKYRTAALVDTVTGYAVKSLMGSQRRRRRATTY
jgi:hypothetical protein